MTPETSFWDAVDRIRELAPRYRREAYGFVMMALGVTVQALPEPRHLSGQELLRGVIELARKEFGLMAHAVFREWGIRSGEDVGEIVFQLVECGQLSARPEDRREDFAGHPDLRRALTERLEIGPSRWPRGVWDRATGASPGGSISP